ncbi:tetratricopeptide repeat protein [Streptomyces cyaneofuscatus]|uniref:tetratricopeptide repeat protein n=1 Tax=Streptomyces cyaneofuscatus TaxID=66883 RepID=UPI00342CC126
MSLPENVVRRAEVFASGHPLPIGRPALASRITSALNHRGMVVVVGGAGVGKSHLIEHGVYAQCLEEFGSVVTWSPERAEYLTSRTDEFVPDWPPPVVVLLDDAVGPQSIPDALLNRGFQFIIVSRAPAAAWRHLSNSPAVVEVGLFDREESVRFLMTNIQGLAEADADRLAEHLDDLPLALDRAVRLFTPDATVDSFLLSAGRHIELLVRDEHPGVRPSSVEVAIREAVAGLPAGPGATPRSVLGALALMDSKPYPVPRMDVPPPWPPWRSAVNGLPPERQVPLHSLATVVVPDLECRGLVRMVDGGARVPWVTSHLVRRALSSADLELAAHTAEVMLLGTVPDSQGEAAWEYWPSWRMSARALVAVAPGCMSTAPGRLALLAACDFLIEQGSAADARVRLLALREAWRNTEGVPFEPRVRALDLLGRASYELGDLPSARRYGAIAFRARRLADDRWRHDPVALAGAAHWALAAGHQKWLVELRRLARYLPDQRLALRIDSFGMLVHIRSLYGPCLADSIHELLGDQRDIISPEHPHTLFTMDLLADAYHRSGRADEARETLAKVLELRARTLGPGHPHTRAAAMKWYVRSHEEE